MAETTNIYGNIQSLDEMRGIYRGLIAELGTAESREDLDEIKKRSEYLCTLADNPQWRDEGERGGVEAVSVCLEQDRMLTSAANERADALGLAGEQYVQWKQGEGSSASREGGQE